MLIAQTTIYLAPHSSSSHIQWGGDDTPLHASRPMERHACNGGEAEAPRRLGDGIAGLEIIGNCETGRLQDLTPNNSKCWSGLLGCTEYAVGTKDVRRVSLVRAACVVAK
jgi:hypothetical protein